VVWLPNRDQLYPIGFSDVGLVADAEDRVCFSVITLAVPLLFHPSLVLWIVCVSWRVLHSCHRFSKAKYLPLNVGDKGKP
jgi:hypothetical protein